MTEHHPARRSKPLNANLVSVILIVNLIVIGRLIFTNTPLPALQIDETEQDKGVVEVRTTTVPELTATPLPPTSTRSPTPTTMPEQIAPVDSFAGDAANGEVLFNTLQPEAGFACATCHRADSEERLIGPGLLNVGTRAETRVEGLSAVEYIRTSIVNPSAFVVDTFPDKLMPQNWAEIYSENEIDDLIAYLMTLE